MCLHSILLFDPKYFLSLFWNIYVDLGRYISNCRSDLSEAAVDDVLKGHPNGHGTFQYNFTDLNILIIFFKTRVLNKNI